MTTQNLSMAISDLYARAIATGQITNTHRRILMEAICSACLADEERSAIDRLLWSIRRGRFELVDE